MIFTFDPKRGLIVVPTDVTGPSGTKLFHLALDTGATSTVLNTGALESIGYDAGAVTTKVRMSGVTGIAEVPRLHVVRITALGVRRQNFRVLAHTQPPTVAIDGILGLSFLRGLRLVIDFRSGEVELSGARRRR